MKRFISAFLALLFVALTVPAVVYALPGKRPVGDVNGDLKVTALDYAILKRVVLGTYTALENELSGCDVNGDGNIDSLDYAMLKRAVLGTYTLTGFIDDDDTEEIPAPGTYRNPVSLKKKYVVSKAPASNYPDTYSSELTDGVFAKDSASYTDPRFSGYSGFNTLDITVDLGDDGKRINAFEVSYLSVDTAGIYIPSSITVNGSFDGIHFTELGSLDIPEFVNDSVMTAVLDLENEFDYRYIRFSVKRISAWVFIDEVTVFANVKESALQEIRNAPVAVYEKNKLSDTELDFSRRRAESGKEYDHKKGAVLVSAGKTYNCITPEYDSRAPYDSAILTDCNDRDPSFESERFVGFAERSPSVITLDLGSSADDLYAFELSAFNRVTASVSLPAYVDISAGDSINSLHRVGRVYGLSTDNENYTYRLALSRLVKGRYVRFSLPAGADDYYYWFDEIRVFANREYVYEPDYLYDDFVFPVTGKAVYHEVSPDYDDTINLVSGRKQQILSDVPIDLNVLSGYNTLDAENSAILTDGVKDETNMRYNGKWMQFGYGKERRIFFDLGAISAVESASLHILFFNNYSCGSADRITLAVSEDGEVWYSAGTANPSLENAVYTNGSYIITADVKAKAPVRARYVAVNIHLDDMRLFLGEVEVFGKKNVSGANSPSAASLEILEGQTTVSEPAGYLAPSDDILSGVKDVMLIYHNVGTVNFDSLLPYVAYVDKDGNVTDTMFDGFLFLPGTGQLPNGGYGEISTKKPDWDFILRNAFDPGKGMDELEKTAEYVKDQLGLDKLELKVFVAIPRIDRTITSFGDVDGDGISENLTVAADRIKVGSTYINQIIKLFNAKNYKNLKLCGLYWFREDVKGGDVEVIHEIIGEADKAGIPMLWIPYFEAGGYCRWKDFGFEAGCYQPNYAFDLEVDEGRLDTASAAAKIYNMCIELEMQDSTLSDKRYFTKYMNYLKHGVKDGYMDAIHMYYQGFGIMARAAKSPNARTRLIYDYTYRFVKRDLKTVPDYDNASLEFDCSKETVFTGSVAGDIARGSAIFAPEITPAHGSIAMEEDGSFTYYPNAGFTGSDTFTFRISRYLDFSEEITVSVNIE